MTWRGEPVSNTSLALSRFSLPQASATANTSEWPAHFSFFNSLRFREIVKNFRIRRLAKWHLYQVEELDEESDPSQPSRFISEALRVASSIELIKSFRDTATRILSGPSGESRSIVEFV